MEKQHSAWSDEDLRASVEAYIEMKAKQERGEAFSKMAYYRALGDKFGRSPKSFEYRMQNISYAYSQLGREWLPGLKPASHVGTKKLSELIGIINQLDAEPAIVAEARFDRQVEALLKQGVKQKPPGNSMPPKQTVQTTSVVRDPAVKAYVLQAAKGKCECCGNDAPFKQGNGLPYLEVHHVKYLAHGGSDTVENAAALCPNCHRALHYAENKAALLDTLYQSIARLVRE